jgi:hypothetical protein
MDDIEWETPPRTGSTELGWSSSMLINILINRLAKSAGSIALT